MDYMQKKLSQRLVRDPGFCDVRAEEDLFYQSFGAMRPSVWVWLAKLAFWAKSADTPSRQRVRQTARKAFG